MSLSKERHAGAAFGARSVAHLICSRVKHLVDEMVVLVLQMHAVLCVCTRGQRVMLLLKMQYDAHTYTHKRAHNTHTHIHTHTTS